MQLKIDFSGKKEEQPLSFKTHKEVQDMLDFVVRETGRKSRSELMEEYVIECVTRDMGKLLLLKSKDEKITVNIS